MKIKIILFFITCFLLFFPVNIQARRYRVHLILKVDNGIYKNSKVTDITVKNTCQLSVLIEERNKGKRYFFSDLNDKIFINNSKIKVSKWKDKISIKWYKIEPLMQHLKKGNDPTVPWFLWYANAYTPESPKDRGWIGFDRIKYKQNLMKSYNDKWIIPADASPTDRRYNINKGMGVMRYAVEIKINNKTYTTPGIKSVDHLGIKNDVYKLIIRKDDSYLGYITSFFNVPGVFGSVPKQVDNYIGVDCADLLVGAYKKWKKKNIPYTSVQGLVKRLKNVSDHMFTDKSGNIYSDEKLKKKVKLKFKPGQIIVFDYPGTKKFYYDHTGILYKDNGNGILDGEDEILHCGPEELHSSDLEFEVDSPSSVIIKLLEW